MGQSSDLSRPKPRTPARNVDEMDGGVAGLLVPSRQVAGGAAAQGPNALLDMELEKVRQGVGLLASRAGVTVNQGRFC